MVKHDTAIGEYVVLQSAPPGVEIENFGILLFQADSDQTHVRFRRDFDAFAGDEAYWFEDVGDEISAKTQELGGQKCLEWMESTLSHLLRVSSRTSVLVDNYSRTVERLYVKHIHPKIMPFRTHLPQYTLQAAAGRFGRQMAVEPEGWIEVWPQFPLSGDMFVSYVKGHSMEPAIPDGSVCVFRGKVTESYEGKVVLVERCGEAGGNRYTVKRYRVSQNPDPHREGDGAWLHERITLESANPEYKSWDIACSERIRIVGEFLAVL